MDNRHTNYGAKVLACFLVALMVFSAFAQMGAPASGSSSSGADSDDGSGTRSKTTPEKKKVLFVFDDAGDLWLYWYITLADAFDGAAAAGSALNNTTGIAEPYTYFVWDKDQDYVNDTFFGTPDAQNSTFNFSESGPSYSGGTYPPIYNSTSEQMEVVDFDLEEFDAVVWMCGLEMNDTLTSTDQNNLKQYLNHGGNLWLWGTDIVFDLYNQYDNDSNQIVDPTYLSIGDFVMDYLKVSTILQDFGTPDTLVGTTAGFTGGALYHTAALNDGSTDTRDYGDFLYSIYPMYGFNAVEVFNSTPTSHQNTGLKWSEYGMNYYVSSYQYNNRNPLDATVSPYKTVFNAFELMFIDDEAERISLMDQTIRFLLNTPPNVTVTSLSEGQALSGNVSINGTASDAETAVQSVRVIVDPLTNPTVINATGTASWTVPLNTTAFANGAHTIWVTARDGVDISDVKIINFTVNNQGGNNAPSVAISSPANSAQVSGTINVTGTATDPDGNAQVQAVKVRVDGALTWSDAVGNTSWSYAIDTNTLANGQHTISAKANDGTVDSSVTTITVTVNNVIVVNAPPVVGITYPDDGDTLAGNITVLGTASDPEGESIQLVQVRVDNGTWGTATGNTTWTYALNGLAAGGHKIDVKATAATANSQTASRNITIQGATPGNNQPAANIEYLPPNPSVNVTINLDGTGSSDPDGTTIASYSWTLVSKPSGSTAVLSGTTVSTPSFMPDVAGNYTVMLIVNDGALSSAPALSTISVAALPPVVIPKPDIIVQNVVFYKNLTAVTTAAINDTLTITATIKNNGTSSTSPLAIKVLFFDGAPTSGGTQIGAELSVPALNAAASANVNTTYKFTTIGSFTICVVTDRNNTINETDETNNNYTKAITITNGSISGANITLNLRITSGDIAFYKSSGAPITGFVTEGDNIRIIANISNTGSIDFNEAATVSFYVGSVSPENLIGSRQVTGINAGGRREVPYVSWTSTKGTPVDIYAVVESGGAAETTLADNTASKPIVVLDKTNTPAAAPGFELIVIFAAIGAAAVFANRRGRNAGENEGGSGKEKI